MIKIIKKIHATPYFKETRSITEISIYRVILYFSSVFYSIKYKMLIKKTYSKIIDIRKEVKEGSKIAFVFANGPSISDIDLEKLNKLDKNKYDLIVVNSYMSNSAGIAQPKFAVFADPLHFSKEKNKYTRDIELCEELGVTYFTPAKYADINSKLRYGFCSLTNLDSSNVTDLTKPAGYYGLTAFYALTLAKMIGYNKIYICGFDNSYFQDFTVGNSGEMYIRHKHYYDKKSEDVLVPCIYKNSTEFFFDTYRYFQYLAKINDDRAIFNIAKFTYSSEISRDISLDIYKK